MADPRWRGVVFDCDGVLVDSEPIANRVLCAMLNELGIAFDVERTMATFLGKAVREELSTIAALSGRDVPPGWYADFVARRNAALEAEVGPIEGIADVIAQLVEAGLPFAVASGADSGKVRLMLGKCGLLAPFGDGVFGAEMVARSKPAPDVYLLALAHLGCPPGSVVVVEDSPVGTRAGIAAGAAVLGFSRVTPAAELRAAGACATFDRMADLPHLLGLRR